MLRLNLTNSLANTKSLFQVGVFYYLEWSQIVEAFQCWFNDNVHNEKDTNGFSLGVFQEYTFNDWRIKLYKYMIDLEEKLQNKSISEKKLKSINYKYSFVDTEEKRVKLINELFPGGSVNIGFHRVARDIIEKHAIIIDFDNKLNLPYIEPQEIINKLSTFRVNYLAYSSFNNSHDRPKFRVIIPTDRPYTIRENTKLKEYICYLFTTRNYHDIINDLLDFTSFEPSRFFYVPISRPNAHKWFISETNLNTFSVDDALKKRSKLEYENNLVKWTQLKEWRKIL